MADEDGYNWRKYGQKRINGREYPRHYYRCAHPNCEAKKMVERNGEGHILGIIHTGGSHNHPKPPQEGLAETEQEGLAETNDEDEAESKKRKLEAYTAEMRGSTRPGSEPRVVVQTRSDFDFLDDGYRWRKYGEKTIKGYQNPRSYYKCTDDGCTVTKHVDIDSENIGRVRITYIGMHEHNVPEAPNSSHVGSSGSGTL